MFKFLCPGLTTAFYVECCPVWNQPKKSLKKKKKERKDGHGIPILGDKDQKNKSCRQQQQMLSIRLGGAKANECIAEEDGTWSESGWRNTSAMGVTLIMLKDL